MPLTGLSPLVAFEICRAKCFRQKFRQLPAEFFGTVAIGDHFCIRSKFIDYLPAGTTWRRWPRRRRINHNGLHMPFPLADRLKDRVAFRANRTAVSGVLHVASREDFAV